MRLVGSLEKRVAHTQEIRNLGKKAALDLIHAEDRGRERYLKKYFNQNPDDPLLYDLVINTDSVSYEEAAHLIGTAALRKINHHAEPAANRWSGETELVYAHAR